MTAGNRGFSGMRDGTPLIDATGVSKSTSSYVVRVPDLIGRYSLRELDAQIQESLLNKRPTRKRRARLRNNVLTPREGKWGCDAESYKEGPARHTARARLCPQPRVTWLAFTAR